MALDPAEKLELDEHELDGAGREASLPCELVDRDRSRAQEGQHTASIIGRRVEMRLALPP